MTSLKPSRASHGLERRLLPSRALLPCAAALLLQMGCPNDHRDRGQSSDPSGAERDASGDSQTEEPQSDGGSGADPEPDAGDPTDRGEPVMDAAVPTYDASALPDGASPDAGAQLLADAGASDALVQDAAGERDADGATTPLMPADKVDLLLMVDNSGSMSEEQAKLARVLGKMIGVLTTGNRSGLPSAAGQATDFRATASLHVGVVSSDMGVAAAPPQKSCGGLSFTATERDTRTATTFLNKPLGDDGVMNTSVDVALAGIWVPPQPGAAPAEVVPADPTCADISFPAGRRYVDFTAGVSDPIATAHAVACIAKLGRNGCGLEQHLESILKALTPSDSTIKFTAFKGPESTMGNGTALVASHPSGPNAGFLRDDASLVVLMVADEDDCSVPDSNASAMFDANSTQLPGEINVRCGLPENQQYLHSVKERFVAGLKALKPAAYQDRIIVAGAVGMPLAAQIGVSDGVVSGATAIEQVLNRSDMQFKVQRNAAGNADEPVPTCIDTRGESSASPARRQLQLIQSFGDNGIATSICADDYGALLDAIVERLARQR